MAVLKLTAVLALLTLVACGQAEGPDGTAGTSAEEPVEDPVEDGIRPPPSPGPVERVDDLELTVESDEQGAAVIARSTGERWFFVVTLASGFGANCLRSRPARRHPHVRRTVGQPARLGGASFLASTPMAVPTAIASQALLPKAESSAWRVRRGDGTSDAALHHDFQGTMRHHR